MTQEGAEVHPLTADEYERVRAVLARIAGLRRAMTATAIIGVVASWIVFLAVTSSEVLAFDTAVFWLGLASSIAAFAPFIGIIGYFSYRVNRHIDRLGKGKYRPPMTIE